MRHGWWKFLAVACVLAASIIALRTPLAPAIVHTSLDALQPGSNAMRIMGYGTRFTQERPEAYIENGGRFIKARRTGVVDDTHLVAHFEVPGGLPEDMSDVVVTTATQGQLRLYDAVYTPMKGLDDQERSAAAFSPPPAPTERTGYAFPNRSLLYESIRNLNFHVPMWFTMIMLQTVSLVFSILVLRKGRELHDRGALQAVNVSLLFAALGLITGSIWARATWGGWWTNDAKLNGAAVTVLIYLAYLVLRGSVADPAKRARLAAIYNIFAYALMQLFVMALPRMNDTLHPGSGGNPAFSQYDLDSSLRPVFYMAVLGWMGIGAWLLHLRYRMARIQLHHEHASLR
jgi:heme exporter protein C